MYCPHLHIDPLRVQRVFNDLCFPRRNETVRCVLKRAAAAAFEVLAWSGNPVLRRLQDFRIGDFISGHRAVDGFTGKAAGDAQAVLGHAIAKMAKPHDLVDHSAASRAPMNPPD